MNNSSSVLGSLLEASVDIFVGLIRIITWVLWICSAILLLGVFFDDRN